MTLKQVAIAMSSSGVIGLNEELYVTSAVDMGNFAQFTNGTVMIAGFNTAQQMVEANIGLSHIRPLIIISGTKRCLDAVHHHYHKAHTYYADSLRTAIDLAEKIVRDNSLNGWTVVGGAMVYDDLFDAIDRGQVRLNHAYIHTFDDVPVKGGEVKIKRDVKQVIKLLRSRMIIPAVDTLTADVHAKHNGKTGRITNGEFIRIEDRNYIDSTSVKVNGMTLNLRLSNSNLVVPLSHIASYSRNFGMDTVRLFMHSNYVHEFRLKDNPGVPPTSAVNYLELILNRYINH